MGLFFTDVTNKNVAWVTSEIMWNRVFWLDNANAQKGEMESLFPPLALSEVSTVKCRGLCNTQFPLPMHLLTRLPVIWNIRCWCVKMDLMVGPGFPSWAILQGVQRETLRHGYGPQVQSSPHWIIFCDDRPPIQQVVSLANVMLWSSFPNLQMYNIFIALPLDRASVQRYTYSTLW